MKYSTPTNSSDFGATYNITYASSQSPHDQNFFRNPKAMVRGEVRPPLLDLANRDLIDSHLQAVWLSCVDRPLDPCISELLVLNERARPLSREVLNPIEETRVATEATERIRRILDFVADDLTADAFFNGSFRLLSAPAYMRNYQEMSTWKSDLNRSWQEVSEVTCSLQRNNRSLGLRCNFDRSEANLSMSSDRQDEVDGWVGSVKKHLELLAGAAAQGSDLQGEKRQYYTQDRLDWQWFEQAMTAIRSFVARPIYFNGRFSLGVTNVERSYGTADSWQKELAAEWREARTTYCWISTPHSRVLFECDVLREQVRLDIEAPTWSEVDRIFQALESKLSLTRIEGVPYRYRSYAKVYGFDEWEPGRDNEAFAQAVEESIAKAFPKSPVVVNAYITEGELSETLKPAYDLADFLTAVRNPAKKWQIINLYVEGSRGWSLGVT